MWGEIKLCGHVYSVLQWYNRYEGYLFLGKTEAEFKSIVDTIICLDL